MGVKRIVFGVAVVLLAAAYLAGYWPERQRRTALQQEVEALRGQVADADARARVSSLLGDLLYLTEAVAVMNYGQAQDLSSSFFDRVQRESASMAETRFATVLDDIHRQRDAVTAALARGDATVLQPLRRAQLLLREALGYPVPPAGAPLPDGPAAAAPVIEQP
jgi:hypothetical protein